MGGVLAHHGIKGMKWGVRKGSSSSAGSQHPSSSDHATAQAHLAKIKAGGVKTLSNHELQQLVTRMNLEKQHRDLAGQVQTPVDKGHSHVKKVLKVAKTLQEIHSVVNSPAGKAARKILLK